MKKVCILINQIETMGAHNYLFFANALNNRGDYARLCFIDSLTLCNDAIIGKVLKTNHPLNEGNPLDPEAFEFTDLAQFDYVWVLGFGNRETFLDKIEILWSLSQKTKIINSIETLMFLHSKYHLSSLSKLIQHPETYASADFDFLWKKFSKSGETWIVKPPALSFGKDVFILKPGDTNAKVILQSMTGYESNEYCIMQRFIPEITSGEKRILFASGHIVGHYKRIAKGDHRTNIHQGAVIIACDLSAEERELGNRIGPYLTDMGAEFVGVDMVYPYILELNVLNPGGIGTIMGLTGQNLTEKILELILV